MRSSPASIHMYYWVDRSTCLASRILSQKESFPGSEFKPASIWTCWMLIDRQICSQRSCRNFTGGFRSWLPATSQYARFENSVAILTFGCRWPRRRPRFHSKEKNLTLVNSLLSGSFLSNSSLSAPVSSSIFVGAEREEFDKIWRFFLETCRQLHHISWSHFWTCRPLTLSREKFCMS